MLCEVSKERDMAERVKELSFFFCSVESQEREPRASLFSCVFFFLFCEGESREICFGGGKIGELFFVFLVCPSERGRVRSKSGVFFLFGSCLFFSFSVRPEGEN